MTKSFVRLPRQGSVLLRRKKVEAEGGTLILNKTLTAF